MIDSIHVNPVRRKLVKEPVEWRWSSCRFRDLNERRTGGKPPGGTQCL